MKIGVLSDTHIPERAQAIPPKVLQGLRGMDMIIHAGDLADIRVIEALEKICPAVRGVSGNMDPGEVRKRFPEKEVIKAGRFTIGVKHGYGAPDKLVEMMREAFKKDGVDIIIFGHSHRPMNETIAGTLFFNPGSPTDDIFAPYKSFGIIEINDTIEARIVKL